MTAPALRTRRPTGLVPWPLILIEGGEKAGKSWACAELSASERVGQTYWLDLSEGAADEYGAVPGARYLIVEHDGSFGQILSSVEAVKAEAARAAAAGEPPVVLVIDSGTAEWELLKGIADAKARQRLAKRGRQIAQDAEPQISMDLWNEINGKHRRLMTHLMTFPGIAVITARGKEVAALDNSGRPVEGSKEYKVEGQKNLAYDATVWIRVSRDHPPLVVGARSVHAGIRPGLDRPTPAPGLTLEKVVFDVLRCNPAEAHVRDLVQAQTDDPEEQQPASPAAVPAALGPRATALLNEVQAAADKDTLGAAWKAIGAGLAAGDITQAEADHLGGAWRRRKGEVIGEPVSEHQNRHMHALWNQAGFANDRDGRLAFTAEIVGRDITSSKQLTAADADKVIDRLKTFVEQNTPPAEQGAPMTPGGALLELPR